MFTASSALVLVYVSRSMGRVEGGRKGDGGMRGGVTRGEGSAAEVCGALPRSTRLFGS